MAGKVDVRIHGVTMYTCIYVHTSFSVLTMGGFSEALDVEVRVISVICSGKYDARVHATTDSFFNKSADAHKLWTVKTISMAKTEEGWQRGQGKYSCNIGLAEG